MDDCTWNKILVDENLKLKENVNCLEKMLMDIGYEKRQLEAKVTELEKDLLTTKGMLKHCLNTSCFDCSYADHAEEALKDRDELKKSVLLLFAKSSGIAEKNKQLRDALRKECGVANESNWCNTCEHQKLCKEDGE